MRFVFLALAAAGAITSNAFAADAEPNQAAPNPRLVPVDQGQKQYVSFAVGGLAASSFDYEAFGKVEVETDPGYGAEGAWGWEGEHWRYEFALGYHKQKIKTVNGAATQSSYAVSVLSIDSKAYYEFGDPSARVRPYVGAGLGVGDMNIHDGYIQGDAATAITLQAMAGGSVRVTDNAKFFVEARYQWANIGLDTDGDTDSAEQHLSLGATGVYTGVRFAF